MVRGVTAARVDQPVPESPAAMLHASNLVTYTSLFVGIGSAMAAVWTNDRALAGAGIALNVILDTFDGRFARRFTRTAIERSFGAQLDSLADAVNAGIVPIVVAGALLRGTNPLWLAAVCLYLVCVVTRLSYYNLASDEGRYFTGLPAPVASLFVATALLWSPGITASALMFAVCGAAMISGWRIPRPSGAGLALFVVWPALVACLHLMPRG